MSKSILIVDDDQSILFTLRDILAGEGFPVRVARNGKEGLDKVDEDPPDLIVLDLWMPLMDGQEMVRDLRDRGFLMPVLVMSAVQSGDKIAERLDAAGYIPKPFDVDSLLDEVSRLLPDSAG